jgi:hypothetical protein
MTRIIVFTLLAVFSSISVNAQRVQQPLTRQDTLRGSITPEREWWDLTFYHMNIKTNPVDSTINGYILIRYEVIKPDDRMQIDLQPPLEISRITQDGKELDFVRDGNAWFVQMNKKQVAGESNEVTVYYGGKPKASRRPPWDDGLTWVYDENGNPLHARAVEPAYGGPARIICTMNPTACVSA